MGLYGTIWDYIWDYMGSIWDYMGLCGTIWDYVEMYGIDDTKMALKLHSALMG